MLFNSPSHPEIAKWLPWLCPSTLTRVQGWRPSPAVPLPQSMALQHRVVLNRCGVPCTAYTSFGKGATLQSFGYQC